MKKRGEIFLLFVIVIIALLISLISAGNYGSGNFGTGVYIGGPVATTSVSTEGEEGCNSMWDCTNWFPAECPETGIQERVCTFNRGTCKENAKIPDQTKTCTYEGKKPLFDIFLTIPPEDEKMCAGNNMKISIKLENYGKTELLDAFMRYWIMDSNYSLISESKDTRSVTDEINFTTTIMIPELTPPGTYKIYAQIVYSENKTAVAGETFEITKKDYCKTPFNILKSLPFILILMIFILIIILYKRFHHSLKTKIRKKGKLAKSFKKKEC